MTIVTTLKNVRITYVKLDDQGNYLYTIKVLQRKAKDILLLKKVILAEIKTQVNTGAMVEVESFVKGLYEEVFFLNY